MKQSLLEMLENGLKHSSTRLFQEPVEELFLNYFVVQNFMRFQELIKAHKLVTNSP